MAETRILPSQHSNIPASLGRSAGQGISAGLEDLLARKMQQKSDSVRANHLRTLMPNASQSEIDALSHFGSSVYEPALRGGFGAIQQASQFGNNQPQNIESSSQPNMSQQVKPLDYIRALSAVGLKITPEQEKQIESLPPEQQEKIAERIFNRLPPKAHQHLEDLIAKAQLPEQNQPQKMQQEIPQQVIGSQQPGEGPSQSQPHKISFGESLRNAEGRSISQQLAKDKFESAQEEKQQKRIKIENAPFVKQLEKEVPIAEKTLKLVNEMLDLEEKGETPENIISRTAGAYLPGVANPYAEYNAKSNEIAALKSQATGRPSVFMTQLQQSTKPNSSMPKEKRINLLNSLKENAEVILGLEESARDIIEENGGKQIPNLKKYAEEKFFNGILPNPSDYEVNTEVEVYGEKFKNSPTGWIKVGKGK